MNIYDYLEDRLWTTLGVWNNEPDQLIRIVKPNKVELDEGKNTTDEWTAGFKVIEAFVKVEETQISILEHLNTIANLEFRKHDSDIAYGGVYQYRAKQLDVYAVVVPAQWLGFFIPQRFKNMNWFYLRITCLLSDMRFDFFPDYKITPANRYRIH